MTGFNNQSEIPDKDLVVVGRVRRPTGIKGAVLVEIYSGIPDRFVISDTVIADGKQYEIIATGKSGDSAKLTFANIDSSEKADHLRDLELSVPAEELPVNPPGIYYHYEILGLNVVTTKGQKLGNLTEILETGSNDVLIITPEQESEEKKPAEILIPVLDGIIADVDKESNTMKINLPEGLL
jgi:16S rRNA processing protein RimM